MSLLIPSAQRQVLDDQKAAYKTVRQPIRFGIVSLSKDVSFHDLGRMVEYSRAILERFCALWNLSPIVVSVFGHPDKLPADVWPFVFVDSVEDPEAFAWHESVGGKPKGMVQVQEILGAGGGVFDGGKIGVSVIGAWLHEIFEGRLNRSVNLWVDMPDGRHQLAFEASDPVQEVPVFLGTTVLRMSAGPWQRKLAALKRERVAEFWKEHGDALAPMLATHPTKTQRAEHVRTIEDGVGVNATHDLEAEVAKALTIVTTDGRPVTSAAVAIREDDAVVLAQLHIHDAIHVGIMASLHQALADTMGDPDAAIVHEQAVTGEPLVLLSDAVTPAYFDADAPGPYDLVGAIDRPFALAPHGYQVLRDLHTGKVDEVFGDKTSPERRALLPSKRRQLIRQKAAPPPPPPPPELPPAEEPTPTPIAETLPAPVSLDEMMGLASAGASSGEESAQVPEPAVSGEIESTTTPHGEPDEEG